MKFLISYPGIGNFEKRQKCGKLLHKIGIHLLVGGGWRREHRGIKIFELYCIECKKKASELLHTTDNDSNFEFYSSRYGVKDAT